MDLLLLLRSEDDDVVVARCLIDQLAVAACLPSLLSAETVEIAHDSTQLKEI